MRKVKTLQIGKRLIIVDGFSPLRYVDLTTNKVHKYDGKKHFKYIYKFSKKKAGDNDNQSIKPIS